MVFDCHSGQFVIKATDGKKRAPNLLGLKFVNPKQKLMDIMTKERILNMLSKRASQPYVIREPMSMSYKETLKEPRRKVDTRQLWN